MTYTTQQLQWMSDKDINKALHNKLYAGGFSAPDNYCNNPNDIMPLAFERAIGIEKSPLRQEWIVRTCEVNMSNKKFRCYVDTNPLRAIACLILMMDE